MQEVTRPFQLHDTDSVLEENFTSQHDEEFGAVTVFFVFALRKIPFLPQRLKEHYSRW